MIVREGRRGDHVSVCPDRADQVEALDYKVAGKIAFRKR